MNSSYTQTKLGQIIITSITILLTLYTPMYRKYSIVIYIECRYLYYEIVSNNYNNNKNNNNIGS